MAVKKIRTEVRKANGRAKKVASELNKLDKLTGGMVLGNPVSSAIVPYMNYGARALDYFDSLMGIDDVTHPQISGGQVAGVSQSMPVRRRAPRITGSRGNITITHKELVGEVSILNSVIGTSPTYANGRSAYTASPTNSALFPWLSSIASNYDYFRFNRLRFVYVPLCATSQTGRVMLAFDPDGTDSVPYDRSALSSYKCSVDSSAWGISKLDAELATNQPWYQTNDISATSSYSTSSQGQFLWATWGGVAATIGEVYVLYDVTLKDPQPSVLDIFTANGTGNTLTTQFANFAPCNWFVDLATDVKVVFLAGGSYRVLWYAATTAATAAISITSGGQITVLASGKVSDGTNAQAYAIVNVTGSGAFTSPGLTASYAYVQCQGLAALGAWTVNVERITLPQSYP